MNGHTFPLPETERSKLSGLTNLPRHSFNWRRLDTSVRENPWPVLLLSLIGGLMIGKFLR